MPFLQLTLDIGKADPAPFEDALLAAGAASITLQDSADDPILEPAPGALPLWPTVTIKALFDIEMNRDSILATLKQEINSLPEYQFDRIEDRAWEREWLKDFKPMRFGTRLWVCPNNMTPPADSNAVIVDLDPGLAFGTGTHPTTALCLEWLDQADLAHKTIIDYGCGSGILAIAALKLGAKEAIGIDIDPQALIASQSNADRNKVSDRLLLQDARDKPTDRVDIVLANILAGPLDALAPVLAQFVVSGGALVLSGILKDQSAHLAHRYGAWFDMEAPAYRDDWARLVGRRRS